MHEKDQASRPNRKGVIRSIRSIKASSSALNKPLFKNNYTEEGGQIQKTKINIFDQTSDKALKKEALSQIGY